MFRVNGLPGEEAVQDASFYNGRTAEHAHNDYLELLADTGVMGGLIGLSFIGLLSWWGLASLQFAGRSLARVIIGGSLTACSGLLLHSLVDFNLHIPSNCLVFLLLSCIATVQAGEPSNELTQPAGTPHLRESDTRVLISGNRCMHRITPDLPISSSELLEKVMPSGEKDVGTTKRGLGPNGFNVGSGEKG